MIRVLSGMLAGTTAALLAGCDAGESLSASARPVGSSAALHFRGLCDASAVAPLHDEFFVVAGDEDNVLRVYSAAQPGLPASSIDLSGFLQVDPKSPEVDLEGAARSGDLVFWVSSHGRNASGKERQSRHRLFATRIAGNGRGLRLEPVGKPYSDLLQDLVQAPQLATYHLAEAAGRAPKARGGLNIEGLAFTPEGHLLIGFRNPVPEGKALLVRLTNPLEVINGSRPVLGLPALLDLGGLGIRSIEAVHEGYVIIAGDFDGSGTSHLYHWKGETAAPEPLDAARPDLNPEAATILANGQMLILSDDGTKKIGGRDCKKLKDPSQRMFRAVVVDFSPERMLGQVSQTHAAPAVRAPE